MKKIFTFLKVFVYTLGFSQGVQIVNPNEGNSVYPSEQYFCEGESFDLKVDAVVSSTGDYSVGNISDFNPLTPTNFVPFTNKVGNDHFSSPITIPFTFNFYGKDYTKVVVGSNGRLIFGSGTDFDNLNTNRYVDKINSGNDANSTNVKIPNSAYGQIDSNDYSKVLSFAQIFAGYTDLGYYTTSYYNTITYGNTSYKGINGLIISFNKVLERTVGDGYTSEMDMYVLLLSDNRILIKVNKLNASKNALIGIQNESASKARWPMNSELDSPYNNGEWKSNDTAVSESWLFTPNQNLTPQFKWYRNSVFLGTTANPLTNFRPNNNDTVKVEVTYLEDPYRTDTDQIIFRKVQTPVIEKETEGCTIKLKVNDLTFDSKLNYNWYREGDTEIIATKRELTLTSSAVPGNYFVIPVKPGGKACSPGNKLEIKKFFPELIKNQLVICENTSTPSSTRVVNLYTEFYPQYSAIMNTEEYAVDFFDNSGNFISNPAAYIVSANQDMMISVKRKLQSQSVYCETDIVKINFISIPNEITIPVCFSATSFDLRNYLLSNYPATSYNFSFIYEDGSSAGDGSSVNVNKIVKVITSVFGGSCTTTTVFKFSPGSSISVPSIPVQEKCAGNQNDSTNWFDLNYLKNLLDPSGNYEVEFYRKTNDTKIVLGSDYTSAGLFWTGTTGDYLIYAKVINNTDPTCFAISNDIVLRVYVRPITANGYQSKLKKRACGITNIDLTVANVFDVINTNTVNQTPAMKYFDGSGNELSRTEISSYHISRGTPYLLIQNGVCNPPLRLNYEIISTLFPLNNPAPKAFCDVLDGSPDGTMKVQIASNELKNEFTTSYANATFEYYDGTSLIHTSNQLGDNFEYDVNSNKIITVKVWSADFCINQSILTFKVNVPTAILLSGNVNLCYGENLSLYIDNYSDFDSVKWVDSKGAVLGTGNVININYDNVSFGETYKISAKNKIGGCESEITFVPSKINQPKIDQVIQTANSIEVIASDGTTPYEYFFNGISNGTNNVLNNPNLPQYIVQVKSATACFGETKTVYFIKILKAFTPNSDGINDFWKIENLGKMQNIDVKVFDKLGAIVYDYATDNVLTTTSGYPGSSNLKDPVWDGKHNGRSLPTSTYWYIAKWLDPVTNKTEVRQGWILLKNRN